MKFLKWLESVFECDEGGGSYARIASSVCICSMIALAMIALLRDKIIGMWDCAVIGLFAICAICFYFSAKFFSLRRIEAGSVTVEFEDKKAK